MSKNKFGFTRHKKTSAHQKDASADRQDTASTETNINPYASNQHPEPPNWVEKGTFVVLVVTFLAACYAGYEAGRLADLTQDLVTSGEVASKTQLRAYVGVIPGNIENFGVPNEMHFKIIRKNYGTTPAYDVGFSVVGYEITDPNQIAIGGSYGVQGCANAPKTELVTMFPGTELPWTVIIKGSPFTADQIDNVRIGKSVFAFYGNVCYLDAWFKPHYTDYCWSYKGDDLSSKGADGCLIHNGSD